VNSLSDQQLLRDYAEHRSEAAFTELVRRHVDLVYSAALRMVRDAHLAEDVTQSAFVALAQNAGQLSERLVLSGWLHRTAQNLASKSVRTDVRRRAREQEAAAMNELLSAEPDVVWEHIAPHLDSALGELSEPDRDALLLRYFERKSAREMAQMLGTTEGAAQKRVNRAVERLRQYFAQRGVTVGASGLVVLLSANAVQAAPAGLAVTISTAAALVGTSITATVNAAATQAIVMTTLQKTLITATLAVAVGTGIYEARQASRLRDQVQTLQQHQAPLAEQIQQLQQERDNALKRLAAASAKPAPRLPAPPMQVTAPPATPLEELRSTNLYSRIKDGVQLTAKQVESYLKAHGRNAASLLAAYRTTGDRALLAEAMQKYPNDPQVALEAASSKDASPEAQRQWLEAFKRAAPENALPNYLLARNYFKAGQTDQAVQELIAAYGKPQVQDYFVDRMSDDEEAYLAAGYSAAEAKALGPEQLELMPNRGDLKQLAYDMVDLANSYRRAGDEASAQAALQMAAQLGRRGQNGGPGQIAIDQFLGFAMETLALNAMDPNSPYGNNGQTARDRLNQIAQQKAALKELVTQSEPFRQTMADQDWIGYTDRLKTFGEEAALRWVLSKYGQK
jgi:RNA polymerase sigma factor (sigma-70 family)